MHSYPEAGARNNAEWCDIVCQSHGITTQFDEALWVSVHRSPPMYPDAVTLKTDVRAEDVLRRVDGSVGCSVKDSFASLDLAPAGFRVLFEAEWIQRAPAPPQDAVGEPDWQVVRTADELRVWGAAHGGGAVFRPALLDHPMVTVLAARDGETVVGGAIANRTAGVVGVSNVFAVGYDLDKIWARAVAAVSARYPGLALVGYESGPDLDAARAVGFLGSGPLRVWLRD